jgi:hypothetical protein
MSPEKVKPDPFFKRVRPVVPGGRHLCDIRQRQDLHDLLYRRGGELCLHLGCEGLPQLAAAQHPTRPPSFARRPPPSRGGMRGCPGQARA